ncbi:hypothetical protein FOA43_003245 [Brettanomyces nanus]|uniref:Uncharacterized protein n=1 Tax=Eeniella nana TaxID=13502 RepID=A0A875S2A5_EENNA|nr:uncharacterized protein FOA43_003245 [Brettanomyces nanus]QPG75861.1 hypothetical protein FOA43_003245 [Brettanomyces nanus]
MITRLIFVENKFDSINYSANCYTKIKLSRISPLVEIEENKHLDQVVINELAISIDILCEKAGEIDEGSAPIQQFRGEFDGLRTLQYDKEMDTNKWLHWCLELLIVGSLDSEVQYEISPGNQKNMGLYFRVRKKIEGIFVVVLEILLDRVSIDEESMDIMGDLYEKWQSELKYKVKVKRLEQENVRLRRDFDESEKSKELFVETNQKIRRNVEQVFIPVLNEQKQVIRDLKKQLGQLPDLNFSSIHRRQLINYQEPNKEVEFEFDENKRDEYRREIEKVSPRKKRAKKETSHADDNSTDKDSDNDDDEPQWKRRKERLSGSSDETQADTE